MGGCPGPGHQASSVGNAAVPEQRQVGITWTQKGGGWGLDANQKAQLKLGCTRREPQAGSSRSHRSPAVQQHPGERSRLFPCGSAGEASQQPATWPCG